MVGTSKEQGYIVDISDESWMDLDPDESPFMYWNEPRVNVNRAGGSGTMNKYVVPIIGDEVVVVPNEALGFDLN